jgi:hypothetical protein
MTFFVGVLKKNIPDKLSLMGCSPFQRFCYVTKGLRPRARVLAYGVKGLEKLHFRPMYALANMGHPSRT